jgi:GTP-binding protein HflX
MFATLDPTVRSVTLPSKRKILLADTVGFIRNLPTTLITAFRATLEEVQRAALLLQVADVTSPIPQEQQRQVEQVLGELEVLETPQIRVMNKIDLLPDSQRKSLPPGSSTSFVSAVAKTGLDELLAMIDDQLAVDPLQYYRLRVPQSEGKILAQIEARGRILKRVYKDSVVDLEVEAPESLGRTLRSFTVFSTRPKSSTQSC